MPGQIVIRCALGTAITNYGDWPEGERALKHAIALAETMPPSEKAWKKLAFSHLLLQKIFVRRAVRPESWSAFFTDAMRYLERGDPERALHRFKSAEKYAAAAVDGRLTAQALFGQATSSIDLGDFARADQLLDNAEQLIARADSHLMKAISGARARVNRDKAIPTLTWLHSAAVQRLLRGNAHRAQALFERALSAAREEENKSAEAENALGIVGALSQRLRFRGAEQRMLEFKELLDKEAERDDRGKALSKVRERLATALGAIDRAEEHLDCRDELSQRELLQMYLDAVVSATATTVRFHFAAAAESVAVLLDDRDHVHIARTMMAVALAETGECAEALSLLQGVIDNVGDAPLGKQAAELLHRIDSPKGKRNNTERSEVS